MRFAACGLTRRSHIAAAGSPSSPDESGRLDDRMFDLRRAADRLRAVRIAAPRSGCPTLGRGVGAAVCIGVKCCQGLSLEDRDQRGAPAQLRPDVPAIVECGPGLGASTPGLAWRSPATITGSAKYVAAVVVESVGDPPHPLEAGSAPYVLPVRVERPVDFILLINVPRPGQPSYPA